MKKVLLFWGLLWAASLPLPAQVDMAGLLNSTEGTLYFVSLPVEREEYQRLKDAPESFKALLSEHFSRLELVSSGGLYQRLPVYRQDTLVLGYVQRAGHLEHPIFAILIQGGQGSNYYEITSDTYLHGVDEEPVHFSSIGDELPTLNNHLVDGRLIDWLDVSPVLNFERDFVPLRILQGGADETRRIAYEDALFWGGGGTFLNNVRAYMEHDRLYWMVTSFYEITEGLSIFLYFYEGNSTRDSNIYTIEVPVAGISGPVLLWEDTGSVEIIGTYRRGDFFIEFLMEKEQLPEIIQQSLEDRKRGSFDLSSGFSDGQIFEDFLFGNISADTFGK